MALMVASLIVTFALGCNAYRPFIKNLRRRLGIDRIEVPAAFKRYGTLFLPFLLELSANLILAGLFKWWPGYRDTFSTSDMLMLGFMRPRMEWLMLWHSYIMWAGAAARPDIFEHNAELRPFLRRPDAAASNPDLPRGLIPLVGEMLLQLYVLVLVGRIFHYGHKHGFYDPETKLPPNGHTFYTSIAIFFFLSSITLLHQVITVVGAVWKLIRTQRAKRAARHAATINTDPILVEATAHSSQQPSSTAGVDVPKTKFTWRGLFLGLGKLGLQVVAIFAWLANFCFWSGLAYSSKGR